MSSDMYSDDGLSFTSSIARSDFSVVDAASRTPSVVEPLREPMDTDTLVIAPELKPQPNRHPMFCFTRDDLVDLQVGGTRFTIHAHLFEGRSDKAKTFIEIRHESPDGVIVIDDISAHDFERFLTILYAKSYDPICLHTKGDWTAILAQSHRWDFPSIRAWAIRELAGMTSPIDRLVLARNYDVHEWTEEAYLAVCQSPEYPSDEDCLRLDPVTIIRIGRAREALRSPGMLISSASHPEIVRRIFDLQSNYAPSGTSMTIDPSEEAAPTSTLLCDEGLSTARSSLPAQDQSTPQSSKDAILELLHTLHGKKMNSAVWRPYKRFAAEDEIAIFRSAIDATYEWLADEDRSELECAARLHELENKRRGMLARYQQSLERSDAIARLKQTLSINLGRTLSGNVKYAHVPRTEMSRLSKACLATERWLKEVEQSPTDAEEAERTAPLVAISARQREVDELAESVFKPKVK